MLYSNTLKAIHKTTLNGLVGQPLIGKQTEKSHFKGSLL